MASVRRVAKETGRPERKGGGYKLDDFKPRFDLIPPQPLEELAHHYGLGGQKYGDRNWERGMGWGRMFAAMMRHAWKWWRGEETDPDTGTHHMVIVAWYALGLREFTLTRKGKDSRP